MKNGLTKSLLRFFFFLKIPKIWVGRKTLNGEKEKDALNFAKLYRYDVMKTISKARTRTVVVDTVQNPAKQTVTQLTTRLSANQLRGSKQVPMLH